MLDFSRQYQALRDEILAEITRVCDSQMFILGPEVAALEQEAALSCGTPHAIGCASGTDALWLAIAAAGIGDSTTAGESGTCRDAIITTPFSFFATASCMLRAGARPLFADIDSATFNLSVEAVERVLDSSEGKSVRAALPVHLYGQCADFDGFEQLRAKRPNLLLIEDAAQAFGASWGGRPAGSLGDAAAFSFYPTKNLAAFGDAGLVTTSVPELAERAKSLRTHGMRRRYFHEEVGWNSRLDSIQAAVLNVKLRHIPEWNQRRREHAARYDELFTAAGIAARGPASSIADGVILPFVDQRGTHVFHQYVIRAPRRNALREYLAGEGIGSEVYYPVPIHLQPAMKDLGHKVGDFPQAERAAAEVLALPIYPEIRDDELQTVVEAIRRFYA